MFRRPFSMLLFTFLIFSNLSSQEDIRPNFLSLGFSYGLGFPMADLSQRFGQNFEAGISIDYFLSKSNIMIGIEGSILFGDNVKEDVLSTFRNENNAILGANGQYADVFLRQRGAYLGALMNKIIFQNTNNSNSGISVGFGLGVLQHSIRILDDSNNAPQLSGNYSKLYDKNTIGPALKQQIGFLNIGKKNNFNFSASIFFIEAFTSSRRSFTISAESDKSRIDLITGIEVKWILPIKDNRSSEEIYY